jgi:hypothetical protein
MGTIPRKIEKAKISGFVVCRFGPLACEDRDDKQKLIAIAQMYHAAVERGSIVESPGHLPQVISSIIKNEEQEAGQVLTQHFIKNHDLLTSAEVEKIANVYGKERIRFIRMWRIRRLLKK